MIYDIDNKGDNHIKEGSAETILLIPICVFFFGGGNEISLIKRNHTLG